MHIFFISTNTKLWKFKVKKFQKEPTTKTLNFIYYWRENNKMKVKDCMCEDVCCVKPETKITEVAKENHIDLVHTNTAAT